MLVKIRRFSGWALLVFMVIFLVSGYSMVNRILLPLPLARYLHMELDRLLVIFFLAHVLISARFALARWRVHPTIALDAMLILAGALAFWMVLQVR
jgi:hypothetical protein